MNLHVTSRLYVLHQSDSTPSKIHIHLEHKDLSFGITWKSIIVDKLNPKWSLITIILSKDHIPLQMKRFELATKFQQLGEAIVENLSTQLAP